MWKLNTLYRGIEMRKVALPLLLLALAISASAQTAIYTTTADGCGAKNLGYCQLNATNESGARFRIVLDARYTASGPINTLTIFTQSNPYTPLLTAHGAFSGFVANPNGTHAAYYSAPDKPGLFLSDDGTVGGTFPFYAYYVGTCSGRGCSGVVVGWHYRVLAGGTVMVE